MSTGRLVRIKIAFRTIKRALISCRSAEWKGCFGIFKRVDAYRRNVQLKRRCSGLESRERQLNRKITRSGEKPVRLSADKTNANLPRNLPRNQRNYRDRLSGGRVIVLFISLVFSLSLSYLAGRNFFFVSIEGTERTRALRIPSPLPIIIATILKIVSDHDNLFFPSFSISRECLRRGSISASISHYGLGNYN